MKILYTLLFALLSSAGVYAQQGPLATDPEKPTATTPETTEEEEEEVEGDFTLSGYVDAYYQANFANSDAASEDPLVFGSSFTDFANTFGIGNVNLLAEKSFGKVSLVGQIGFGPRAVAANSDSNLDFGGLNFASTVQQLFVTYAPTDNVTFTLGNFGTFVGYEVIDAPANMNYSMSYLFSNGPFYHTGAKVDFAFGEGFGAMVGVFNDTDSKIDVIGGKHIGGQLSYSDDQIGVYLNALAGTEEENFEGDEDLNEFQIDLTGTVQVSESFMLGLNASSYSTSVDGDGQGGFFGTAVYATIGATDDFDISLRGEYFANTLPEDVDGDAPSVLALTASGNIEIGGLRIIPEVRFDTGSNGFTFGDAASDESAFAFILAGVYAF